MPNHVHFLIFPTEGAMPLKKAVERFKGRRAREVNRILGREGRFWQQDWFDRWMRDEAERARTVEYIRMNPVKAGMVKDWRKYPGRISEGGFA